MSMYTGVEYLVAILLCNIWYYEHRAVSLQQLKLLVYHHAGTVHPVCQTVVICLQASPV